MSPLFDHIHLVNGVPVDYMHCVAEGVVKSLLTAWTSPKNHKMPPYSIRKYLNCKTLMKHFLINTLYTNLLDHLDQSYHIYLTGRLANLKYGFYVIPFHYWCMNKLPSLYLHHYSLLVCAMHLLQKQLSTVQCNAADEMLHDFHDLLPELYAW